MRVGVVTDPGFVGRSAELAAIASCATSVVSGRPWLIWIEGEAGSGKTALVRQVIGALPSEFEVLRAEAAEAASDAVFDVAGQLLGRAGEEVGEESGDAAFPVALELLAEWTGRARHAPLAVVVEDLHWADAASRLALATAARRLGEDRVLLLVTSRSEAVSDSWERLRLDPQRCLHVALGPLSGEEVSELAARSGVVLAPEAAQRLAAHTAGLPLWVRTLLVELPPALLVAPRGPLPAPRSLAATMLALLAGLSESSRSLAGALAVLDRPVPIAVAARVAGLEHPLEALDGLVASGLVRPGPSEPPVLALAHPLYRAAIYAHLPPSRRQALHAAAAGLVEGPAALAHRVAAAAGFDDALAAELDEAAASEAGRGHLGRAACYLQAACELSSRRPEAEARLLASARWLLAAAQIGPVDALLARLEACASSARRDLVLGLHAWAHGDAPRAERLLAAAAAGARQAGEDELEADALAQLAIAVVTGLRGEEGVDAAQRAVALSRRGSPEERAASMALAFAEAMLEGAPAGLERIAARLDLPPGAVAPADVDLLITRGVLAYYAGKPGRAAPDLRQAIRLARHAPSATLPRAHLQLSQVLYWTGAWDEAIVQGRLALAVGDERHSWFEGQAHAVLCCVHSGRGEWAAAEEHLAAAEARLQAGGTPEGLVLTAIARSFLAGARDDQAGVRASLEPLATAAVAGVARISPLEWWPPLVVALWRSGEKDAAERQLEELRRVAAERRLDLAARILGLEARLSAAHGRPDEAADRFAGALAAGGPDDPYLDVALLRHDLGRLLLARGRKREAAGELLRCHERLSAVAARPYIERVEADLAAAGVRSPQRSGSPVQLTEREADVVALVATGRTNGEVAASLYLSVNTIDYHLRNVFTKLGVTSRRQLRERYAAGIGSAAAAAAR